MRSHHIIRSQRMSADTSTGKNTDVNNIWLQCHVRAPPGWISRLPIGLYFGLVTTGSLRRA